MGTFKLATSEDFDLAIYGDFLMATDIRSRLRTKRRFQLSTRSAGLGIWWIEPTLCLPASSYL